MVNCVIVGDAYSLDFFRYELPVIAEEYGLEALHNSIGCWIDYREWLNYPVEWGYIGDLIRGVHSAGLPVGVTYGYHVSDSVIAPYDENVGFLYYYRTLPTSEKWHYPNGTVSKDPYSVGSSRSFSGYYAIRILGNPMDIERYKRLDFYSTMQPQNPYWKEFFIEWGKKTIDLGTDAIFLDSPDAIFTFFWGGGWGCADTWEGKGLISYLKSRFSEEEIKALGVRDINNFCLRKYLIEKYGEPEVFSNPVSFRETFLTSWPPETVRFNNTKRVLQDPIVKEALMYWYKSAIEFVREVSLELKSYAAKRDKSLLLTSNHYFAWIPHITLAPYMDVLYVETNQFRPPPFNTRAAICKLGISAVNGSKPVWISEWILNFANPFAPNNPPHDISNLVKLRVAEAYASGCIMLVPFGTGSPSEGWPPKRLIVGSERNSVSKYYRFIKEHEDLFINTSSMAETAIVISLPTAVWNFLPALGIYGSDDYQNEFLGWARVLEFSNIPYDVLLLGMKGILNTDSQGKLGNYKLLIAPHLTHISDENLVNILKFLNNGGLLITTEDLGAFDEYHNPRTKRTLVDKILEHSNTLVVRSSLGRDYMNSLQNLNPNKDLLTLMRNAVEELLNKTQTTANIEAPPNIYVSILGQKSTGRIIIHLVNYNYRYDSERDYIDPSGPINISLKLPAYYPIGNINVYTPDGTNPVKPQYSVSGKGELKITIPKVNIWEIIVIEPRTTSKVVTKTETITNTVTSTYTQPIIHTTTATTTITQIYTTTITSTVTETKTAPTVITAQDWIKTMVIILIALIAVIIAILAKRK